MKKILFLTLLCLVAAAITLPAKKKKAEGTPSIKFTETVWDFGNIKNDRPATHDFEFINQGDGNLYIVEATAECGCTRPEWPEKPIAPGKKGKIKVSYNPIGRPGSFEKTITVKTNGSPKKARVKIRGVVLPN
ncbi:MAG: DUF1573 domain-containing protein [Muribaculaceae bacterium]|nr:DUF1573 domain-containing protein [Muribaculaceae bacterium]